MQKPTANRRLNVKHCNQGHSVGLGFPCGCCSPLYWATIGRPWLGGWLEFGGFWSRCSAASLAVVFWLGKGWFLLVFKGTCRFCQATAFDERQVFFLVFCRQSPGFRWRNWRDLFAACHFFVSLIYVLDIVAKLRFLGWKFWKLIGSALAPSTAGWATNRILRIIHGISRKVLHGVTRVTKLWYVMMLIKPWLIDINRKDGVILILIVSDTLIQYLWIGTHAQSGLGRK